MSYATVMEAGLGSTPLSGRPARARTAFLLVATVGLAVHAIHAAGGPGGTFVSDWLYCGLFFLTAAACAARARRDGAFTPWGVAAIGVVLWGGAEVAYRLVEPDPRAWFPPVSTLLLFLGFSLAYTTIAMLARARVPRPDPVLALDGLIVGLAAAAVAAALIFPVLARGPHSGEPPEAFLVLALVPLLFVLTVLGLTGWRPGGAWALIATAIGVNVLGDVALVHVVAGGDVHRGSIADTLFAASALLLGAAAFFPVRPGHAAAARPRRVPVPLGGGILATGLLASGVGGDLTRAVSAAALVIVLLRMVVAVEALEHSRRQALTDGLTGLGNRRRLLLDLRARLREGGPFTLALFDLDGFKGYNDAFGHLSGDALLSLLAERLALAVAPGRAYRMGGDEFCALIDAAGAAAGEPLAAAEAALAEQGERFDVRASAGVVTLPVESGDVREALTMADMRMYAEKGRHRGDRAAVLSGLLGEAGHEGGSAEPWLVDVAVRVARRLGLGAAEVDRVGRATALHDVGKMAMPEDVVRKRGPLDADEWRLMRQHPVVGERLLRSTPALSSVAPLVRSSHERWDGSGYPDGLAGEEIELGARIVAVCDAYAAMRSRRPHRPPLDSDTALGELELGAGGQFDPAVVAAFRAELPD